MTITIDEVCTRRGRRSTGEGAWSLARLVLAWPARVWRARRLMLQLGSLDDRELRDIGLSRQDLRDASALSLGDDPSALFRSRVNGRRGRT